MMVASLPRLLRQDGQPLQLGGEVGKGGEATVFTLSGVPGRAVKLYHQPSEARAEKLRAMIANKPEDPTRAAGHVSIAWPEALVFDERGQVVGFVMPLLDTARSIPLHQVYHPKSRLQRAPKLTWRYLLRIAHNLCAAIAALHAKGYVIGDLNESNILVADNALVTLVDCDSVQVRSGRRVFRCPVGKGEYTAPELQGKAFGRVNRTEQHDVFALAVLIFMLLMEGVSPFSGVYREEGDPPHVLDNIRAGRSPYLGSRELTPSPLAPPFTMVPPNLRRLLQRALGRPGWGRPRPTATAWQRALRKAEQGLKSCGDGPNHLYGRHLSACPWCERKRQLGFDAYPSSPADMTPPRATQPPFESPAPSLQNLPAPASSLTVLRFYAGVPLLSLCLLTLCTGLGYLQATQALYLAALWQWPRYLSWSAAVAAAFLPAVAVSIWLYHHARTSAHFYGGVVWLERFGRSALGATLVAFVLTEISGIIWQHGSVLAGDWLLLPPLWVVSFFIFWRVFARHKPPRL